MFIKEAEIKRLFKEAYKSVGLRIASDEKGLIFTGRAWYIYIYLPGKPAERNQGGGYHAHRGDPTDRHAGIV